MKRIRLYIVLMVVLSLLGGCGVSPKEIDLQNAALGVIETKGNKKESRIIVYDNRMNAVGALNLPYASMGNTFSKTLTHSGGLYVVPQGYFNKKDEKKVLRINLQTLKVKEFDIDQIAINDVAVSDDDIYTSSNLNYVSYIRKLNGKTGRSSEVELPRVYVSHIAFIKNRLYAFGSEIKDNGRTYIYIYDENLALIKSVDITAVGMDQYDSVVYGNEILFASLVDVNDESTDFVAAFDMNDYNIRKIPLGENNVFEVSVDGDNLYVSHFDAVHGGDSASLSVVHLASGKMTQSDLKHGAEQMLVRDSKIYFLSNWKLYSYNLRDMKQIGERKIEVMDHDYSYLSGMFSFY